nr:MAG TPA: hypothetical protein [Caudoviricetes sp.]
MPTEDIKEGKIYCIRDTSSTAQDNNYIEYAYINNKWEKVGEFQAKPNLSGYAKLSGATFTGDVTFTENVKTYGLTIDSVLGGISFLGPIIGGLPRTTSGVSYTTDAFCTGGNTLNVGNEESFVFTLENGSTVTKSIRVISTTTSKAGA